MFQYEIKINGIERKSAIRAVGETLNAPVCYLRAPSFAFEAGGWHIDREGVLTSPSCENAIETCTILDALIGAGAVPGEFVRISFDMELTQSQLITIKNLLKSKERLIRAALGLDSPVECVPGLPISVEFILFLKNINSSDAGAQIAFFARLIELAKRQKRAHYMEREIANEKYAMRCFLLRLGFIGKETARERKALLSRLSGNSAFGSEDAREAANARRRQNQVNSIKNI